MEHVTKNTSEFIIFSFITNEVVRAHGSSKGYDEINRLLRLRDKVKRKHSRKKLNKRITKIVGEIYERRTGKSAKSYTRYR